MTRGKSGVGSGAVDVCLISAGLPSSNPRLVKEAAALTAAGFRVHCVVTDYATPLCHHDENLLRKAGASFTRVGLKRDLVYRLKRCRNVLARHWVGRLPSGDRVAVMATSAIASDLIRAASRIEARLYIGHTLPALPAAVLAAERHNAIAGFDAEDFHPGETGQANADEIAHQVCRKFLPRCRHRTTASPLITAEYQRRYEWASIPILNSFSSSTTDNIHHASPLRLYWFSQTIGPGRGLEALLKGACQARNSVCVSLRGIVSADYRERLASLVTAPTVTLSFLPPADPDEMVALVCEHHVGLSLEKAMPLNRDLCLTNKVFTYLAAGIPQIVSRTSAQSEIAATLGRAAVVVDLDCPEAIGLAIDQFANGDEWTACCDEAALRQRQQYAWELESQKLIRAVRLSLQETA